MTSELLYKVKIENFDELTLEESIRKAESAFEETKTLLDISTYTIIVDGLRGIVEFYKI
jgi:hypothetical protein